MDLDIRHSFLFTGAGAFYGALDTRPAWAQNLNINLDPRFSDVFKNVELPLLEAVGVAAATVFTAGTALPFLAGAAGVTAAGLATVGVSAAMTTGIFASGGIAAGIGAGALFDHLQAQSGTAQGQGFLAENASRIGSILGGGWVASHPGTIPPNDPILGPPSPGGTVTVPDAVAAGKSLAAAVMADNAHKAAAAKAEGMQQAQAQADAYAAASYASAPASYGQVYGPPSPPASTQAPKVLFLGALALAAFKLA